MSKYNYLLCLLALILLPTVSWAQSTVDTVPYHCNFESEVQNSHWTLVNGSCYNYLALDTAVNTTYGGHKSLYVTQQFQNGQPNSYKIGSSTTGDSTYVQSRVFAYTTIYFPTAGTYDVGYWWHCMGETVYDFGRVILAPTTYVFTASTTGWDTASSIPGQYLGAVLTPNVCISLNGNRPLSGSAEMRYHTQTFTITTPGAYRLAVMWLNDGNIGENPPLMIDDISIVPHDCPAPENLVVDRLTDTTVTLAWGGTAAAYEVAWDTLGTTSGWAHIDTVITNSYTIRNLFANGQYEFVVRALCTTSSSLISTYHIHVPGTSCPEIYTFPYSFDLDSATTFGSASTPPELPCWGHFNDANSANYKGYPYLSSTASYAHTGTHSFYYYYTSTANYPKKSGIIMPRLGDTVDMQSVVMKFWMRSSSTSYSPRLVVGVMSDPYNVNSFVACDTVTTNSTTHSQFIVPLSNYTGNGRYVALMTATPSSGTSYYAYVDDIVLDFESCIRPSVTESVITDTSASFTWLSTNASFYQWRFPAIDTIAHSTPDTTLTFTGLTPNTSYSLYLRSYCATAGQWNEITFTTDCGKIRLLPWEEDFESCSTGVRTSHPCWHFLSDGSGTYLNYYPYITSGTTYAYGGNGQYIYVYLPPATTTTSGMPTYECLVLPEVDTNEAMLSQLRLSFYASTSSASYYDYLYLGTVSDPNDASTFVAFDSVYVNTTRPALHEINLYNAPAGRSHLAFMAHRNATTYRYFYIDQVSLQLIPDCPRVNDVYADNITTSSADIHWTDTLASSWQIYYGIAGFDYQDSSSYPASDTMYSLYNLQPNTEYDVWILPTCFEGGVAEPLRYSFRTHCLPLDSLPYTFDWEEVNVSSTTIAPEIPCWNYITTNPTAYYPYVSNTASYQHLGTRCAYWFHPTTSGHVPVNYYTTLVSPEIPSTYSIQNIVVKMWVKATSTSYVPTLAVGVMTDPTDDSTFVPCQTVTTDGTTNWNELIGSLSNYTGTGSYVAIRDVSSTEGTYTYWYAYVDEITLEYSPCPPPVILSAEATTDSANIVWTGTSAEYIVEINGGTLSNAQFYTYDTTFSIGNLQPNTPYTITIRGICGIDSSDAVSENIRTECDALTTLPFTYGFEGAATGTDAPFPYCWYRTQAPGATTNYFPYVNSSATYAHTGANYLYWYGASATTYPDYTIVSLPELGGGYNIANTSLLFWARPTSVSYHPVFVVGVMDDPDSADSFVPIDTVHVQNILEWQGFETSFASYTGTGRYAALKSFRPTAYWYSYVDDIELFVTPNCARPAHVTDSNVSANSFDIYWDNDSSVNTYQVHIYHASEYDTTITTTVNHVSLTGLNSNTPYTVQVRGICSATDTSQWSFPVVIRTGCAAINTFPYVQDFEDEPTGSTTLNTFAYCWNRLNNGTTYFGYPYVNSSTTYNHTPSGTKGLYWYDATTLNTYGDYQCIVLPEVDTNVAPTRSLVLSFWTKASSTTYSPVFKVGVLTDPTDINTFVGIDTIHHSGTTWTEYTTTFENYTGNGAYVAIKADRGTVVWYAYVDDITLTHITHCTPPTDVYFTSTTTDATLSWTSSAPEFQFSYRPYGSTSDFTTMNLYTNSVTLTGLTQNTAYEYQLIAVCDSTDSSSVVDGTFRTELCDNSEVDTIGIEVYSSDYSYLPFYEYYMHTYTQQIIDSASMQDLVMIDAIDFYTNNAISNAENCTIYLCHTTKSEFASTTDWQSGYDLIPYYAGSMNMTPGWNRFTFDSAFVWDGHRNVIVAVVRTGSQEYYGGYAAKRVNLMDDYTSLYSYSTGSAIDIHSPAAGTLTQFRNLMRLVTCGDRTCHQPEIDHITTTYTTAEIVWDGGMTEYEIAVKPASEPVWPEPVRVNTTSYLLDSLMPATTYLYSIRQICDSVTYSDWLSGQFVTDTLPCHTPTNLQALAIGGLDIQIDWTAETDTNPWQIHLFNTVVDTFITASVHPFTIEGLTSGFTYNITVSTLCGGGIVISDPSDTLTVTTDLCQPVEDVTVSNISQSSAYVQWTAGDNNSGTWLVNYGYEGMTAGSGMTDTAYTTSYTIMNLEPEIAYEVYVQALCADEWSSVWTSGGTFTTAPAIGIDNIDNPHNFTISPNPASQHATVQFSGVEGRASITLLDMQGRTLNVVEVTCDGQCSQQLDLSRLAQGTYFVRVSCAGDTFVKKLVIK